MTGFGVRQWQTTVYGNDRLYCAAGHYTIIGKPPVIIGRDPIISFAWDCRRQELQPTFTNKTLVI